MHDEHQIPIWYFIGWLLALYGAIIAVYSLITWGQPPSPQMPPEIHRLHAGFWWGLGMTALGILYIVKFPPAKDPPPGPGAKG